MKTSKRKKTRGFEIIKSSMLKISEVETIIPVRHSEDSAGYDFTLKEDIVLKSGQTIKSPTDIKAYMLSDEVLKIYIRSSIGIDKHITLSNGTGIIDSDYYNNPKNDGNITFALYNFGKETVTLKKGERIAQGVFVKYLKADGDKVNAKRKGGTGSTNS